MAIKRLSELLAHARENVYAVGYFEAWDTYSLEAVAEVAEEESAPAVLGFGGMMMEQTWLDRFGVEPLGAYASTMAARLKTPAAVILNEVWDPSHAIRGASAGFNTVMANTCHLPFEENVAITKRICDTVHPLGVEVQAELGRLPNFGEDEEQVLTSPDEAADFVRRTGVDFMAVSIGNQHLRTDGVSTVDISRLREIRKAVDIPLVIHGGSGYPTETIQETIQAGVTLFHVGTIMKKLYHEAVRQSFTGGAVDYQAVTGSRKETDFLQAGKLAIKEAVRSRMRLFGASGKAR